MNESKHTAEVRELKRVNADLLAAFEAAVFAINYERTLGVLDGIKAWAQLEADIRAAIAKAKGGE